MAAFSYSDPLYGSARTRTIRLIDLYPGWGRSPISCRLRPVSLSNNPHYEAISYCWGNAESAKAILCNGKPLSITQNLYDALCQFRKPDRVVTLWADAICINQNDLNEKSEQVPLMNRIYGQAHEVQVWLGAATVDDPRAANAVAAMTQLARAYSQCFSIPLEDLYDKESSSWTLAMGNDLGKDELAKEWPFIMQLLVRPWFMGAWIIQEVALAHERSYLHCGDTTLWWPDVVLAIFLSSRIGILRAFAESMHEEWMIALHRVTALAETSIYVNKTDNKDGVGMMWLLYTNRSAEATDLRDKVYALLSLTRQREDHDSELFVTPDYHIDAATLYQRVTEKFLAKHPKLFAFSAAGIGKRSKDNSLQIPSWVVDWSKAERSSVAVRAGIDQECETGLSGNYNACLAETWPKVFEVCGKVLKLQGYIVDDIVESADLFSHSEFESNIHGLPLSKRGLLLLSHMHKAAKLWQWHPGGICSPTGEDFSDAYLRTMLKGGIAKHFDFDHHRAVTNDILHMGALIFALEDSRLGRSSFGLSAGLSLINKMSTGAAFEGGDEGLAQIFLKSMFNQIAFRTRRGYMGVAFSQEARVGDQIALVRGGIVPLLLRHAGGNSFSLVNETYVHGMMAGEAFNPQFCQELCLI
ncbi:Heterokaryon incompatibility protein [Paramyrothecium foliicola]|nr:Heterokaryon incompatibility protein [Paramyrothecium foliicola]